MSQSLFCLLLLVVGSIQNAKCDSDVVDTFDHDWTFNGTDVEVVYSRKYPSYRDLTFLVHDPSKDYLEVLVAHTDQSDYNLKTYKYKLDENNGSKLTAESVNNFLEQTQNTPDSNSSDHVIKDDNVTDALKKMNFSWVGDLGEPVEINSTKGLYFLAQSNGPDSKVDAMFMDLATKEVQRIGDIEHFSVGKGQSKSSRTHGKFGECWWHTDEELDCGQQQLRNGHPWVNEFDLVEMKFPRGSIDWFAMDNLQEPAIILAWGKCPGKVCERIEVSKVSRRKRQDLKSLHLNVTCENSYSVKIDDRLKEGMFCFHFNCNQKRNGQITAHYSRRCMKRDIVTNCTPGGRYDILTEKCK